VILRPDLHRLAAAPLPQHQIAPVQRAAILDAEAEQRAVLALGGRQPFDLLQPEP
jgi:hypothetical protein